MSKGIFYKQAYELVKNSIYDDAEYLGEWNGFEVYEPVFYDDKPRCIGFPQFIICRENLSDWSRTENMSKALLEKFYPSED